MSLYKRGNVWWYKFAWNGETIRESTRQTNKRTASQIEDAHRTSLAKGEVGIRDRQKTATLREFAEADFLPFVRSTFDAKVKTRLYYENGVRALFEFAQLADAALDTITGEGIAAFASKRQRDGLATSSINRELQVLRRMFAVATEWGKVVKPLPKVRMIPGEAHRERILTSVEETRYLAEANTLGESIVESFARALVGIRATLRGEQPLKPHDPYLVRDVATVLTDCGMRPEECFRLKWENIQGGAIRILTGKTENARRRIPLSPRAAAIIEMRRECAKSDWVFPAPTKSGHIEPSSLKKGHQRICKAAGLEHVPLYTFRHTCLTRWAGSGMDPWTLAHLAGHGDMSITRRYVHPQEHTVRAAMERARQMSDSAVEVQGGHNSGHSEQSADTTASVKTSVIN